ncbi:MAG TPA: RNA polymerase sigma factor [Acidimicrobiales bacterium]|nr:RNA polymerase sigma factor [Acidimicrobiales bacterium]
MDGWGSDACSDAVCISESLTEPQRFAVIFERHAEAIHRFLTRRVEAPAVDDILSETFVVAFRTRSGYDTAHPDARPWLFGIAVNVVRHHRRSEGRRLVMVGRVERDAALVHAEGPSADEVASDVVGADEVGQMMMALSRLDDRYRDVLMLFAGPGLSYEEISRALQIPVGTVRSRLWRGRARLRELLGVPGQYPDDAPVEGRPIEGEHIP